MTELLERAFEQARELPESEQNALAEIILEELHSEERWQRAFAGTQDQLAKLVAEAKAEYHAGSTQPLDPDPR